jgi:hypothetical protein
MPERGSRYKRYGGFFFVEIGTAFGVLALLLTLLAISLQGFARFNRYQLVRQNCIAAAQAQLDCIAITGEPIARADFDRLWPNLSISTKKSPGSGQWLGTELVKVTATGKSFRKAVKIEMARYISPNEAGVEGK